MKYLIIRFSSIGDIVLTTPVVRCLKQQITGAEVHYLTKSAYRVVVENNPFIDKCHFLDDNWEGLMETLSSERFDGIIDLHHNIRTFKVRQALHVPSRSFQKLNIQKWLLTALKINILPPLHIVDRYMETVKHLGVVNDGKGLDFFIPDKDQISLTDIPFSHSQGYIGIVIGAALATKKLPVHSLIDLCGKINHPLILLGGKEDKAEGDLIAVTDPVKIYNACGKFNLNESADLIRRAKVVITHDTGLMHIAAALQKPVSAVWGNTVPAFGMTPYYGAHSKQVFQSFEVKPLSCRPCSKIGYDKCPRGHFKCMEQQDLGKIARSI